MCEIFLQDNCVLSNLKIKSSVGGGGAEVVPDQEGKLGGYFSDVDRRHSDWKGRDKKQEMVKGVWKRWN